MADDNKPLKYMRYAIGEIVLVVIGILIALQINNWNEERKLNDVEFAILKDIKSNLLESRKELNSVVEDNQTGLKHFRHIIQFVNEDLPYSSTLDTSFALINLWASPYLTYTAYETLKTQGLNLIKNDSIKYRITKMYESDFAYLISDYGRVEWVRAENIVFPFFEKNIRRSLDNFNTAKPNNFEALKKNDEFMNILHTNIYMREWGIYFCQFLIDEIDILIDMINKELNLIN